MERRGSDDEVQTEQIQKIFDVFGTPSKDAWPTFDRVVGSVLSPPCSPLLSLPLPRPTSLFLLHLPPSPLLALPVPDALQPPSSSLAHVHVQLPGMKNLKFKPKPCIFREHIKKTVSGELQEQEYKLLEGLLTLNPDHRLTANQALNHDYFYSEPMPAPPRDLDPSRGSDAFHEWQVMRREHGDQSRRMRREGGKREKES